MLTKDASGSPQTGTLDKALSVLEIVVDSGQAMRFTDILNQADQPRGTLHRQLTNLVREGLLTVNPDRSYAPGLRLLKFASQAWFGNEVRAAAQPHLKALHEATGESVHLAVLSGAEIIYLDQIEACQPRHGYGQTGTASPAYCTGAGKAALSLLADDHFETLSQKISFQPFTDATLTSPEALAAEIVEIRKAGVAFGREEHQAGIRCIAAPIQTGKHSLAAAISVTVPTVRVSEQKLESWAVPIKKAALGITREVGQPVSRH